MVSVRVPCQRAPNEDYKSLIPDRSGPISRSFSPRLLRSGEKLTFYSRTLGDQLQACFTTDSEYLSARSFSCICNSKSLCSKGNILEFFALIYSSWGCAVPQTRAQVACPVRLGGVKFATHLRLAASPTMAGKY